DVPKGSLHELLNCRLTCCHRSFLLSSIRLRSPLRQGRCHPARLVWVGKSAYLDRPGRPPGPHLAPPGHDWPEAMPRAQGSGLDATRSIIGEAPAIEALRAQIRQLAPFDARGPTVLLHGETGTGKGLVAGVLHRSGARATGPFVDVNCAAIPENMLEAELFGFEAGAFTDAKRVKPGLFEVAAGGSLFLDEVDALPLALQGKVLKAIEDKTVRRLGAVAAHRVDVKLIAATQHALLARVAAGSFRADLYHRLAVVVLHVPPLRERAEDVLLLAEHFLAAHASAHGVTPKLLDAGAHAWLRAHSWPGNVRELAHLMERATLQRLCIPLPSAPPAARPSAVDDESERIRDALVRSGGNVVRAARLL